VSRISCHDGQSSRSSPSGLSGRWFSGRSFIDCKTTDVTPERKRMPSDVGQARSPLSSRSARTSLIQSSLGLCVVMHDNKEQNCVASLFDNIVLLYRIHPHTTQYCRMIPEILLRIRNARRATKLSFDLIRVTPSSERHVSRSLSRGVLSCCPIFASIAERRLHRASGVAAAPAC
jgi:hypothetical protein